jgi:putative hemolysin
LETEVYYNGLMVSSGSFLFHSTGLIANIVFLLILLFISALFSGAEIAMFYFVPNFRFRSDSMFSRKQLLIRKWLDSPVSLRVAIKISSSVFKFLFILLVIYNVLLLFYPLSSHRAIFLFFIFCFFILYLVCIEIIPKVYAEAAPEKYALFAVYFLAASFLLFSPFTKLFHWLHSVILRNVKHNIDTIGSENDTDDAIVNSDIFTDEEEMAKGIAKFGDIEVSQILRPRVDIISLDYSQTLQEILNVITDSGYSRIPVCDGDFDNMKGILYVKDLLPYIYNNDNFIWQAFVRPPYFVPESKKVIDLLNEFKINKIHMAIIVDEYGCTLGIVTLEDVLEEIVGEIADESDEEEEFFKKLEENTYIFDAKILLNDFYKIVQVEPGYFDPDRGDADTLAGLILELKGEIPLMGEEISYKQFVFKMEAVDSRRIKQIKVTIMNSPSIFNANI